MLDALLARESALRGYSESAGEGFLQAYDEATAALAAAADKARRLAGEGDSDEKTAIAEQERLAERWAGVANDTVIRIRNGRPISAEATAARNDLVERFERANDRPARPDRRRERGCPRGRGRARRAGDRPAQRRLRGHGRTAARPHAASRGAPPGRRDRVLLVPAGVRRDAAGDTERRRGARAPEAASRAFARRLGDRRPQPQQQPEPARGSDTGRSVEPARPDARRLLAAAPAWRCGSAAHTRRRSTTSRCSRAASVAVTSGRPACRRSSAAK